MPVKTFYLHDETSGLAGRDLMKDGVLPEVAEVENTSVQTANGNSGPFKQDVLRNSADQVVGNPTGPPPAANGWESDANLNGTFDAGTWTVILRKRDGNANAGGHPIIQLAKGASGAQGTVFATGENLTDWFTGATATVTVTATGVPAQTFTNERLILYVWNRQTVDANREIWLRKEGSDLAEADRPKVTTPNFTPSGPTGPPGGLRTLALTGVGI